MFELQEQDKSSDIEQQPPFGDPQIKQYTAAKEGGGGTKPTGTSYNFDKVWSGASDGRFGKKILIRNANNLDIKRKRKRSDSVLWQKPLHRQKNPKSNVTTHKRHQKQNKNHKQTVYIDIHVYLKGPK